MERDGQVQKIGHECNPNLNHFTFRAAIWKLLNMTTIYLWSSGQLGLASFALILRPGCLITSICWLLREPFWFELKQQWFFFWECLSQKLPPPLKLHHHNNCLQGLKGCCYGIRGGWGNSEGLEVLDRAMIMMAMVVVMMMTVMMMTVVMMAMAVMVAMMRVHTSYLSVTPVTAWV